MKFSLLALVVLVAVCSLVRSDGSEKESVAKLMKKLGSAMAHGISHKVKGFFGAIGQFFKSKEGTFTIEGTPLVLKFHAHSCKIKIGRKRMLLGKHVKCEAVVSEKTTGIKKTCIKEKQMLAVECASKAILEEIKHNIILGKLDTKNLIKHTL